MTGTPHVLIIGGGIGGLCLAQGLRKAGLGFAVYERGPARLDDRDDADGDDHRVRIGPQGARALYACLPPEAWEEFTAGAEGGGRSAFVTERLRELLVLPQPAAGAAPQHSTHSTSARALRRILLTGLDGHLVHYDREFTRYEHTEGDGAGGMGGGIRAHFADGSTAYGDLLAGADGADSRVRGQLLPHAVRADTLVLAVTGSLELTGARADELPEPLTAASTSVLTPRSDAMFCTARHVTAAGWRGGFARSAGAAADLGLYAGGPLLARTRSHLVWTYVAKAATFPREVAHLDGKALRAVVAERIADWHPALVRLVAEADPETVVPVRMLALAPVDAWTPGPVTLLGDAIHGMPALGGSGATTALRDARLLSRLLARRRDPVRAIAAYESEMRAYGAEAVMRSLRTTRSAASDNRLARTLFRGVLRTAAHSGWLRDAVFRDTGE
ncbi:NAD(P)/FAD-dependent oxidoreductase [Streptomyces sp. NBC_00083]|uniref:FAD-dependent oxidoreductase n=1 Tax=Streptomyces sp. NBC_00083 TaxID=2975647 RepID=UPI002250B317|nr:FAD-dependent monooxygenase [Streptomyces sp. NBC_00083]MCX5381944.1 FAD-dependent monooxygenase [Streptomyces sp. NBC_00083]